MRFRGQLKLASRFLALAWCLGAPCYAHAAPCLANFWGNIIAEAPIDEMGHRFHTQFGQYIAEHVARPDAMDEMALEMFKQRLELAKDFKTFFAEQMEPGWASADGVSRERWNERIHGVGGEDCWSFGVVDHERADAIHKLLDPKLQALPRRPGALSLERVRGLPGSATARTGEVKTWDFEYARKGAETTFRIHQLDNGNYFIEHSQDRDVPRMLGQARALWRRSLDSKTNPTARVEALAEFEWLWFWVNPFGRAGALTGDALSLMVQRRLRDEGTGLKLRDSYRNQDLEAISTPLDSYIRKRADELIGARPLSP
jgi:hypothetical protein